MMKELTMRMSDDQPVEMPATLYVQLERIRRSGEVNMAARNSVQAIASRRRFHALVMWLEDFVDLYFTGLSLGFAPDRALTTDELEAIEDEDRA
jgi:hypothetical protein